MHAELQIGDSVLMLPTKVRRWARSVRKRLRLGSLVSVYVADVDAAVAKPWQQDPTLCAS